MSSGSAYYINEFLQPILHFSVVIFTILLFFKERFFSKKVRNGFFAIVFCYLLLCGLQYFNGYPHSFWQAIYTISKIFIAAAFSQFYLNKGKDGFVFILEGVLSFIAWHALIGWAIYPFINSMLEEFSDKIDTFYYIFFYQKVSGGSLSEFEILGFSIIRNQGLMWEPSVLQFYASILMIIRLFVSKKDTLKSFFLPLSVILSTWSTTGFFFLMGIIFIKYVFSRDSGLGYRKYLYMAFGLIFVATFYPYIEKNFREKFEGDRATSSALRVIDAQVNYTAIQMHPLIGNTFDVNLYKEILQNYGGQAHGGSVSSDVLDKRSFETNSLLVFAGQYGVLISILLMIALYSQRVFIFGGSLGRIAFSAFILIECALIPLVQTNFIISILLSKFYLK